MTGVDGRDAVWGEGQLLAFSGLDAQTSHARGIVGTTLDSAGVALCFPGKARVVFADAAPNHAEFGGDYFVLELAGGLVRGAFVDAFNLLIEGECAVDVDSAFAVRHGVGRTLIGVSEHLRAECLSLPIDEVIAARLVWREAQPVPPGLTPQEEQLYRKALAVMKTQIFTPEGRIPCRWSTPDRWPHRHMWLWDSVFHAIGWRHLDPALARELLSAVFAMQQPDGFIPHMMQPEEGSDITQPPVLAYGASLVYAAQPARDWLAEIYDGCARYLEWDCRNRDSDGGGLLEWFIEGNPTCRSGESGLDNSPRFDAATRMDAVDFNCFLSKEYACMAEFARILGRPQEEEQDWLRRKEEIDLLINARLWSAEDGFYFDYDLDNGALSPVWAVTGFLPLFCGAASREQAARLLAHLENPQTFGTPLPLPSVALNEPSFGTDMWRGPAWLNMGWLIAEGLRDYGYKDKAEGIRRSWLAEVGKQYRAHGSIYEYYDARGLLAPPELSRKGRAGADYPHRVIRDYGWSVTLTVDWLWRGYRT